MIISQDDNSISIYNVQTIINDTPNAESTGLMTKYTKIIEIKYVLCSVKFSLTAISVEHI